MDIKDCDFSGMVTMNDLKCSDGRIIRKDSFKHNDGAVVPLVWNHMHNEPENILGKVLLKNVDNGVRGYGFFNDTERGEIAKGLISHGDIASLSIFANQLKHNGPNVMHGNIREVSLVLAGANPGASIDYVNLSHSDDSDNEDEAIIYTGLDELLHSDLDKEKEDTNEASNNESNENEYNKNEDKEKDNELKHSDSDKEDNMAEEKTVKDVWDEMTDEQKAVAQAMMDEAVKQALEENNEEGEDEEMKHNVFDNSDNGYDDVLVHDGLNAILKDRSYGTLRESYLAHAEEYGIENIDFLNPDYEDIHTRPPFINNQPTGWIATVINGVHNTPYAKVRMMFADITDDEARAKGYTKGKYKKEEVFKLLKRKVDPTTIYKKQKFDRDDLADVDFDILPWIREEMNTKFDEEKARAYIFGDGRSTLDEDKIDESNIIPVVNDEDFFSLKVDITREQDETFEHAFIRTSVEAQDDYQGSGNLTAFVQTKIVTKLLLMEDKFGHRLYPTMTELASAIGVNKIEKVPAGVVPNGVLGVILDLSDYNVGMKNMGKSSFFEDFDIDYNQNKYLLETRQSGALIRPFSAIVLKGSMN